MKSPPQNNGIGGYALLFGCFLGLAILKFGNPVILDQKIIPPASFSEFRADAWPTHWGNWIFFPLALAGAVLVLVRRPAWPGPRRLWLLPILWFGWQGLSASRTVDATLTAAALWQFAGCVAAFFIGTMLLARSSALRWLLVGLMAALAFCLIRGIDQRLFEFPTDRQALLEGERSGWTNTPPEIFAEMKRDGVIIHTNGMDVANPVILAKYGKGRVMGTLVYPNALADVILLLWPVSLVLAFNRTRQLRPLMRGAVIGMTLFLGSAAFVWTGSKLGWLIALAMGGACLFQLPWPLRLKWGALIALVTVGLGIFAIRFHGYFAAGATSTGARLDYWRAAVEITTQNPLLGTGPGTFQRPYAQIKSPDAEMARLAHNDYLEQFSDSGIAGGIFYATWIITGLLAIGRRIWTSNEPIGFAIFLGVSAWFLQGLGEFGLYIPALAWTAFALFGVLLGLTGNQIDKLSSTVYSSHRT